MINRRERCVSLVEEDKNMHREVASECVGVRVVEEYQGDDEKMHRNGGSII